MGGASTLLQYKANFLDKWVPVIRSYLDVNLSWLNMASPVIPGVSLPAIWQNCLQKKSVENSIYIHNLFIWKRLQVTRKVFHRRHKSAPRHNIINVKDKRAYTYSRQTAWRFMCIINSIQNISDVFTSSSTVACYRYATPFLFNVATVVLYPY